MRLRSKSREEVEDRERERVVGDVLRLSVHVRADLWNRQGESEFRSFRVRVREESGGRYYLGVYACPPSPPSALFISSASSWVGPFGLSS